VEINFCSYICLFIIANVSDLKCALRKFIKDRTVQYRDSQADALVSKAQDEDTNMEDIVRQWETAFKGVSISNNEANAGLCINNNKVYVNNNVHTWILCINKITRKNC
jgi:hypothetical protein